MLAQLFLNSTIHLGTAPSVAYLFDWPPPNPLQVLLQPTRSPQSTYSIKMRSKLCIGESIVDGRVAGLTQRNRFAMGPAFLLWHQVMNAYSTHQAFAESTLILTILSLI